VLGAHGLAKIKDLALQELLNAQVQDIKLVQQHAIGRTLEQIQTATVLTSNAAIKLAITQEAYATQHSLEYAA